MDVFPKFLIEIDDENDMTLVISKVTFHKEMAIDIANVRGGGTFSIADGIITLFGASHQFGAASIEDIKQAIKNDKVYTNPYATHSIAKKYTFLYNDQIELIKLN